MEFSDEGMASKQELTKVSYQDLRIYQRQYKEALKQVGISSGKIIYVSSTSQLLWGSICVTIGVLALVRSCDPSGVGIWSGAMYLFCGIVGLVAAGNVDYTVVMCYLITSMMALSITITALWLAGQQLNQNILHNIAHECTVYSSTLLSFSFVEAITAITAAIIAFQLGKGSVTHSPLPDLHVFVEQPAATSKETLPPVMSRTAFAFEPNYQQQFL